MNYDALKRLWQGVLVRAIEDAQGRDGAGVAGTSRSRITEQSRRWLLQGNCHEFRTACDAAGIDPEDVRQWAATQEQLGWPKPKSWGKRGSKHTRRKAA